jgi:hypothetical protein
MAGGCVMEIQCETLREVVEQKLRVTAKTERATYSGEFCGGMWLLSVAYQDGTQFTLWAHRVPNAVLTPEASAEIHEFAAACNAQQQPMFAA